MHIPKVLSLIVTPLFVCLTGCEYTSHLDLLPAKAAKIIPAADVSQAISIADNVTQQAGMRRLTPEEIAGIKKDQIAKLDELNAKIRQMWQKSHRPIPYTPITVPPVATLAAYIGSYRRGLLWMSHYTYYIWIDEPSADRITFTQKAPGENPQAPTILKEPLTTRFGQDRVKIFGYMGMDL